MTRPHDVGTGSNVDVSPQDTAKALGYFGEAQIFYDFEALAAQQFEQLGRIKKTKPRFTTRGRSFCDGYDVSAAFSRIILKRLGIIENDNSLRYLGDELQGGRDRLFGQIRHNAKPLEERRLVQCKPYSRQAF